MKAMADAKRTMLLHSEAKVEFYKTYLQRYLHILYRAQTITEINIFDVFCGTGIYDNGKKGSPIVAFDAIAGIRAEYGFKKRINLYVNDGKAEKIEAVRSYIEGRNEQHSRVTYVSRPADQVFEEIVRTIERQPKSARNLLFIDPYGYKEIKRETMERLLFNDRTEIILFLPISQMQRFTTKAVASDLRPYEPLKEFVHSFFRGNHPIKEQKLSALEYIENVKEALRFGKYYATSYFLERDESNYYALFFISPKIYGFEKILEVKWQLDKDAGRGFKQPVTQDSLFHQQEMELQKATNYERLEKVLTRFLTETRTNREIYQEVLTNEFLPTHAAEIFRNWQNDSSKKFEVLDAVSGKPVRKGSFYVNWDWFNPAKNKHPKVFFNLR